MYISICGSEYRRVGDTLKRQFVPERNERCGLAARHIESMNTAYWSKDAIQLGRWRLMKDIVCSVVSAAENGRLQEVADGRAWNSNSEA